MPNLILHHISYPVRDLSLSAGFYEELFELERLPRPSFSIAGVWFACGDRQIHLVEYPSGTFRSNPSINIGDVHFAFRTDDFEGIIARLKGKGFSETAADGDPKRLLVVSDGPAKFAQLYLLDPDLNTVEVNAAPMGKIR
jgi:catechol 2,3-dioxygenase-like lactoylglutathione lyase family enzyme